MAGNAAQDERQCQGQDSLEKHDIHERQILPDNGQVEGNESGRPGGNGNQRDG